MPLDDGYHKEIEREAARAVRRLTDLERDLNDEIVRILSRLDTKDGEYLKGQARNVARARAQVIEALKKLGVRPVSTVAQDAAANAADKIGAKVAKDLAQDGSFSFDVDSRRVIGQVLGEYTDGIADVFGDAGKAIVREINAVSAGGVDVDTLIARASERARVSMSQARTLIDTAVSAASRQTIVDVAGQATDEDGAGVMVFLYTGPDDDLTRDFCNEHMGRYMSASYVNRTKNDQRLPMASTCGGYNCRHSLAPVMIEMVPDGEEIL